MAEYNLHKGASKPLFDFAKANRKKQTDAENLLWQHLRGRKLQNFKFRRQHPLDNFIPDFYCHKAALAIEIDGGYHTEEEQKEYDAGRTYELKALGITIIRFTNEEILDSLETVLQTIKNQIASIQTKS